ncbi:MAG TPA: aldo/keto reductase [Candidatus Dietzia intestinipullorum]|nr:aldo/keto reductase [Candidatus Dietzia intestinipullorum]
MTTTATSRSAHNGFELPAIGFGTVDLRGVDGTTAIASAIDAGYRLIDSAFNYENEGVVGRALEQSGVDRSELLVTSKLPGRHHEAPLNRQSIEESRARLGVDAIDLHLIHWPNPRCDQYVEAWRAMIDARERGVVRQIGVSNFLPEHLERIESETGVRPVVNQIEIHPYFPQEDVLELHRERGILVEAWSPLGQGGEVLTEPVITNIAEGHGCTPAQVVLAWHLARGVIPIPRSSSPEHQRSNLAAADITLYGAEVEAITALGRSTGRMFDGDPAVHEEF